MFSYIGTTGPTLYLHTNKRQNNLSWNFTQSSDRNPALNFTLYKEMFEFNVVIASHCTLSLFQNFFLEQVFVLVLTGLDCDLSGWCVTILRFL
jgi:hypothetical protein